MPDQQPHRPGVGVGVIVERNGKVLLVRRTKHGAGTWSSPGGYVDLGESPEETAVRETQEETGVRLAGAAFLGLTNDVHPDGKHNLTLWFAGLDPQGEARVGAPGELDAVKWFPWDALPQPIYLPLQRYLDGRLLTCSGPPPRPR
jgi:8-oxo-dGTP diphosphatase